MDSMAKSGHFGHEDQDHPCFGPWYNKSFSICRTGFLYKIINLYQVNVSIVLRFKTEISNYMFK